MFKRAHLVALAAVVIAVFVGSQAAMADTSGTPDTNTRLALAPATASSTQGQLPTTTLTGAVDGQTVNIHAEGESGKFFGVSAVRLCRTGLNITASSQLSPTSFGNCIANPLSANSDAFKSASAAPTNTALDMTFRVGTGTEASHPGPGSAITCDASNPCSIWIWESVDTSIAASGNVFKHYDVTFAGQPGAPTINVTPGSQQLTVSLGNPANTGNATITQYSVTVDGVTHTAATGNGIAAFTGLNNFQSYPITARVTNTASNGTTTFTSADATGSGTPLPAGPAAPTGSAGDGKVTLNLTAPAGPAPDSYVITSTPAGTTNPQNATYGGANTQYDFTGLTNGVVYTFTFHAVYAGQPGVESAASTPITPNAQLLNQTITVRRPVGNLVLTQACATSDPLSSQYPYPVDANGDSIANYPTSCAVNLGTAHLITSGAGKGQFFEATGSLREITVVNTRDADDPFTLMGQMGTFTGAIPGNSFSGSQLGWQVTTTDTPAYTDSLGGIYDMQLMAAGSSNTAADTHTGSTLAPNQLPSDSAKFASGVTAATAALGHGLGIGTLNAALTLWIPLPNNNDTYTGVLQISAI